MGGLMGGEEAAVLLQTKEEAPHPPMRAAEEAYLSHRLS